MIRSKPQARPRCFSIASATGSSTTPRGRPAGRCRTCCGATSTCDEAGPSWRTAGLGWLRLVDNGVIRAASSSCRAARRPRVPPDPGGRLEGARRSPATCRSGATRRRTASQRATRARTWKRPPSSARSGWSPTRSSATTRLEAGGARTPGRPHRLRVLRRGRLRGGGHDAGRTGRALNASSRWAASTILRRARRRSACSMLRRFSLVGVADRPAEPLHKLLGKVLGLEVAHAHPLPEHDWRLAVIVRLDQRSR